VQDPKRLSAEFTLSGAQHVPLLTPSSHIQSVPPSPLNAEFTSTPPLGVKHLPVMHAARELQFDCDMTEDHTRKHLTKIKESRFESLKSVGEGSKDGKDVRSGSQVASQGPSGTNTAESSKAPSRSNSATFFEDSVKLNTDQSVAYLSTSDQAGSDQAAGKSGSQSKEEKPRTVSGTSTTSSNLDTVSIDDLAHVVEGLQVQDGEWWRWLVTGHSR